MFELISDVHLEWKNMQILRNLPVSDNVLIIAGDFQGNFENIITSLEILSSKYRHIIYVPGNHEYYSYNIHEFNKMLSQHTIPNLSTINADGFLDCVVDGKRFVGCTGWGSLDKNEYAIYETLNDFKYILADDKSDCVSLSELKEKHDAAIAYLKSALQQKVDFVITHHVPCNFLVRPEFQNLAIQPAYIMNVDVELFTDYEVQLPEYWLFGHTHDFISVDRFDIKFRCNPVGYVHHTFNTLTI